MDLGYTKYGILQLIVPPFCVRTYFTACQFGYNHVRVHVQSAASEQHNSCLSYSEKLSGFSEKWFFKIILIDIPLSYPQSHQHLTCVVHCRSAAKIVSGRERESKKKSEHVKLQRLCTKPCLCICVSWTVVIRELVDSTCM